MKTFFIVLAFLGGFLSTSALVGIEVTEKIEIDVTEPPMVYETKQIYIPWIGCRVHEKKIDVEMLDMYVKECFAIGPNQIKMTMPSI